MEVCEYCGTTFEDEGNLRPYGVNNEQICYDCGMLPSNIETTRMKTNALLDKAYDASPIVILGGKDGPKPYMGENAFDLNRRNN